MLFIISFITSLMLTSSLDDNDLCMLIAAPLTPSLIPRLKIFY